MHVQILNKNGMIAEGTAKCSIEDVFSWRTGRNIALGRAIKSLALRLNKEHKFGAGLCCGQTKDKSWSIRIVSEKGKQDMTEKEKNLIVSLDRKCHKT